MEEEIQETEETEETQELANLHRCVTFLGGAIHCLERSAEALANCELGDSAELLAALVEEFKRGLVPITNVLAEQLNLDIEETEDSQE